MRDDTVRARTGRDWSEWTGILDAVDAASWEHRRIAEHLHAQQGVPQWWAQMVAVGYERIRGLRQSGQRRDGSHEFGKSRTLPVPIATLYRAWSDPRRRKRWLHDVAYTTRKATPEKIVRLRWPDGTHVELYFQAKGDAKSQITVQHRGFASKADAEPMKAFWQARLDTLTELFA
ncbi:MAG: hypothetical protein L0271_23370 [Gemmatimonadetes bacterium]|nr:hypothetical protein [Gemmatimonadota bacterium]